LAAPAPPEAASSSRQAGVEWHRPSTAPAMGERKAEIAGTDQTQLPAGCSESAGGFPAIHYNLPILATARVDLWTHGQNSSRSGAAFTELV